MAKSMWDASTPPHDLPTGYDAAAGYIGGDTPHVWTHTEWARLGSLAKLPIWVRSNPGAGAAPAAQGKADGFAALEQLYTLGVPHGCAIAADLETAVSPAWVNAFHSVLKWAGYHVWVYGSRTTVFGNPPCDGYWVADYTGQPHFAAGNQVRATQWTNGPAIDKSIIHWWSWRRRLWR